MDRAQDGSIDELLEIIRRAEAEDQGEDAGKRVESLPRTNAEFQTCGLFSALNAQLEAQLGAAVDEAVASDELELGVFGGARPEAIDRAVARLTASPSFVGVVDTARSVVAQAAGVQAAAAAAAPAAAGTAGDGAGAPDAAGSFLRRNVDAWSSSDTEREGMHAKKKPARRDDWVGIFDLGGGLDGGGAGGGGGFFSPRVDVEAALDQLEAGLESPGGSAASVVEALGLLAEADPELFQFGNHWPPFLKLARRSLNSTDPAIHAKAMTLHWVMYEKSMGMCAADMCEGVLAHARVFFSSAVHVLSAPSTRHGDTAARGRGCENHGEPAPENLRVVGDSRLACAAREAKALHGMLVTIHETFQHLPEARVWSIVDGFFFLFGDAVASSREEGEEKEEAHGHDDDDDPQGGGGRRAFVREHGERGGGANGGGDPSVSLASRRPPAQSRGQDSPSVIIPAHLLAVAGRVDEWLPGWLKSLPTGRLVRAVNNAGLLGSMALRCELRGRIPFREPPGLPSSDPAAASNGTGGAVSASSSRAPTTSARQPEACPLKAAAAAAAVVVVRHRLRASAGSSGALCSAAGSAAAPLGRALWLPAAELERALLLQSVSFLGVLAAHCRGTPRPCPPCPGGEEGSEDGRRRPRAKVESGTGEAGVDRGLEQGKEALQALVQCVRRRDSCRADERGTTKSRHLRRQSPASGKEGAGSTSVRRVALGYVGQLAKATAGGTRTPFTPLIIDYLLAPLGGRQPDDEGQGDSTSGRRENIDRGTERGKRVADGLLVDETPAFLAALAETAGVLLSSRGASAGFFVDGPEGPPRASRALLQLLRCTAELAHRACWCRDGPDGGVEEGGGVPPKGRAGPPSACRFRSLERADCKRLAVEFACALLAPIMGSPPKLRAAGRAALWQCGVPHALAELVAFLGDAWRDGQSVLEKEDLRQVSCGNGHASGRGGNGGGGGGGDHDSHEDGCLRDRLLLSLVEWARDLEGVFALRQVGLAGPCASLLSRELGRRHLNRSTRDESADPRLLAVAMRLALSPEGLGELLSSGGGVADGVQGGLDCLGDLASLPELLQYHTTELPPPHAVAPQGLSGHRAGVGGCAGEGTPGRSPGLQLLGGDAGDLRCLGVIGRLAASGVLFSGADPADPAAVQMKKWLRWGLSRVAPPRKALRGTGDATAATAEDADVTQDVRLVALELVTNLAADLTTAVEIEAEWSLTETLARQKADEEPAIVRTAAADDAGARGEAAGRAAAEAGVVGPGLACSDGGVESSVLSITRVPDILEPAALARARLAVSLTCLGGPNEERHKLLRKLREAEAMAGSGPVGSGHRGARTAPARTPGGILGMSDGVEFPADGASDEDWWDVAGRCVPAVAALLAGPGGARRTEAFSLLRKAAARRSHGCPEERARRMEREGEAMDCCASPGADGERDGGSVSEGGLPERRTAVMSKLCFSYARSLGFVDDGHRKHFGAGLKAALAAAPSPASPSPGCDWFAAVALVAAGTDSAEASAMLRDLRRHPAVGAAFVPRPHAGRHGAARGQGECSPLPAPSETRRSSPGAAATRAGGVDGVATAFCVSPSASAGGGCAAAAAERSPPPRSPPPPPPPPPSSLLLQLALVEEVLEEELPLVSAALRSSGWAAAPLAGRWMRQSMLGVVDWPGVAVYLALTLLRGHDYQVYFVVALFRVARPRVMEAASRGLDLMPLLGGGEALEDFCLEESLSFMEGLERCYRSRCVAATRAYLAR